MPAITSSVALSTLGLSVAPSKRSLQQRYHQLAREHHPDKAVSRGIGSDAATTKFREIQSAYEFLKCHHKDENPGSACERCVSCGSTALLMNEHRCTAAGINWAEYAGHPAGLRTCMRCKVSHKSVLTEAHACQAFEEICSGHEIFCQLQREGRAFRDASHMYFWRQDLERCACEINEISRSNIPAAGQAQSEETEQHGSHKEACKPIQEDDVFRTTCKQEQAILEEAKQEDAEEDFKCENKPRCRQQIKRRREAGFPKGPIPAFGFFTKEMWSRTRVDCPATSNAEFTKGLSAAWLILPAEEKAKYNDLAKRDRDRYDEQLKAFHVGQNSDGFAGSCGEGMSLPVTTGSSWHQVGANRKKRPRWKTSVIKVQ